MKRFLFQLNHPAHYHLYRNTIKLLRENGNEVLITNRSKDILEDLLKNEKHINISKTYATTIIGKIVNQINREKELNKIIKQFKPDVLLGTSGEIAHLGKINKIPSIFFGEDDVTLSFLMYLGAIICYPFFKSILAPVGVNNSIWNRKTVYYKGFQKLAYLHPNYFQPDRSKIELPIDKKYFLLRFANLQAYHDVNAKGISDSLAIELINLLEPKGEVLISSERKLPDVFQKYEFKGNKNDIHHYLYFADLFIGDSQSMAVESAMLGTPNIRFNDFVGKISVLEEIEKKYQLSIGINSNNPSELLESVNEIINDDAIIDKFRMRKEHLLSEKIDVTAFFVWFVENYPESVKIMKDDPDYQLRFK